MSDQPPAIGTALMTYTRQAPVTVALMVASVAVAFASGLGTKDDILTWLTLADLRGPDRSIAGGLSALQGGEIWRLITPIFIHFGIVHLAFNMMWMKDLGHLIERRWSSLTLLLLVLVSAVLSNVAQFLVNWDFKHGLLFANAKSGGMSGVVYALFSYVWIRGRCDPSAGIGLPQSLVLFMLGWLVFCMTGILGHIGNSAHAVGLVVGMVWGWIAAQQPTATRTRVRPGLKRPLDVSRAAATLGSRHTWNPGTDRVAVTLATTARGPASCCVGCCRA